MAVKYTMIATQNGTTTVTWPNFGSPDTGGTGLYVPSGTLTNIRVLSVEDVEESWQNLDATLMQGTVQGHWDFDGDLTDSSGNGFTLTHISAAPLLYSIIKGLQCLRMDGEGDHVERTVNDASLRILGTLSLWAIYKASRVDFTYEASLVEFGPNVTTTAVEANNVAYRLFAQLETGRLGMLHQHGAFVFDVVFSSSSIPLGDLFLISVSRDGSGNYEMFVNGESLGTFAVGNAATGATGADIRFRVGGSSSGLSPDRRSVRGYVGGVAVTDATHTLAQHQIMYDHVRGLV